MRIVGLKLHAQGACPPLEWNGVSPGLNAVFGPAGTSTTRLADFLGHVLFGKRPMNFASAVCGSTPHGEATVEGGSGLFRLRRYQESTGAARLTVAALDGSPVDEATMRSLVSGLSPTVLAPLCAVSFADAPRIAQLLSPEFAREMELIGGRNRGLSSRRMAELAARRDLLAQELETRIAGERRASNELDGRWRELDRVVRNQQQEAASVEQRLHAAETALAETDARLRYRRLELNIELRWQMDEPAENEAQIAELDEQITHWRRSLADLGQREASVRAQLSRIKPAEGPPAAALSDQSAWLTVARQLSADLVGEVARLARASEAQRCVCRDAHPRLRPVAETMQRQLDVLESLIAEQRCGLRAAELQVEVENLCRTQSELRRHLEQLLDRRQALSRRTKPGRRLFAQEASDAITTPTPNDGRGPSATFSAADAEQLESRRLELEQERFELINRLRALSRSLRDLRAEREAVERQRAALLSARSIEHVQRELADVQRKLDRAASDDTPSARLTISAANTARASGFLAQLTDGGLVRLDLDDSGLRACVVNRTGNTLPVESLIAADQDQVCLSLCLANLAAAAEHGVWLPLLLDDPFLRLDSRGRAALAAVLDDFCRQGHQVLVLTSQPAAAERLASLGAAVHDIASLHDRTHDEDSAVDTPALQQAPNVRPKVARKRTTERRPALVEKRKKGRPRSTLNGNGGVPDRSDAA